MGSEQRFDYTVMGDAVNLGSRLEGANKSYKTHILINETTYAQVKDDFVCMELDSVRVKGKNRPVCIYELVGRRGLPSKHMEAIDRFQQGLELYKTQKWDEAIAAFESVNSLEQTLYAARPGGRPGLSCDEKGSNAAELLKGRACLQGKPEGSPG
ncbi:MAG: adenylate/guanylate cyclase domain-containing protein, partial [Clostridia bacterium]